MAPEVAVVGICGGTARQDGNILCQDLDPSLNPALPFMRW